MGGFVADLRTVLGERDFRRLFAVRLTSQHGDGVLNVALAAYVFFSPERQTTATGAAAAISTLFLPYSLVGPFAGVLLDRWRRRQVLLVANLVRTALVLSLAGLVLADVAGPVFFAVALMAISVNRFFLAGLSAALPHVVRGELLVMGNAVSPTAGTLAAAAGGAVGFLVTRVVGDGMVLVAAAGLYLTSSLLALRLPANRLGPDFDPARPAVAAAVRRVLSGLGSALVHLRARPRAWRALATMTAMRFGYGVATVMMILLYRNAFHRPDDVDAGLAGLALVFVASAGGFLAAALLTPMALRRLQPESWAALLLGLGAVIVLVPGALLTEASVLVVGAVLGLTAQGTKIVVDTLVQRGVDDAFRGRVFALYDMLFNLAFVAAALIGALMLPADGRSVASLGAIAAVYAVTALLQRPPRPASGHPLPAPPSPPST